MNHFYETLYTKEKISKAATTEFLLKFLRQGKYLINNYF